MLSPVWSLHIIECTVYNLCLPWCIIWTLSCRSALWDYTDTLDTTLVFGQNGKTRCINGYQGVGLEKDMLDSTYRVGTTGFSSEIGQKNPLAASTVVTKLVHIMAYVRNITLSRHTHQKAYIYWISFFLSSGLHSINKIQHYSYKAPHCHLIMFNSLFRHTCPSIIRYISKS